MFMLRDDSDVHIRHKIIFHLQMIYQTKLSCRPALDLSPVLCQTLATIALKLLGEIYFGHFQLLFLGAWFVLGEALDPCHASLGEYTPSNFWGLV